MRKLISIDPGVGGGYVIWNGEKPVECRAWSEPNLVKLHITEWYPDVAVMERVQPGGNMRPHQAGVMMQNFGTWIGLLTGVCPINFVYPYVWQRPYGIVTKSYTTRKLRLRDAAKEFYPKLKPTLKTADAILIGHWYLNRKELKK